MRDPASPCRSSSQVLRGIANVEGLPCLGFRVWGSGFKLGLEVWGLGLACCGWVRLGCVLKLFSPLVAALAKPFKGGCVVGVLWACFEVFIAGCVLGAF